MQTKYDVGQTIFFEHLGNVDKGVIEAIDVYHLGPSVVIRYHVEGLALAEEDVSDCPMIVVGRLVRAAHYRYRADVDRLVRSADELAADMIH